MRPWFRHSCQTKIKNVFILALKECLDHNTNDTIFFEGKKRDSVHSGGAITRIIFDQGNTEYFRDGAFRMKLCLCAHGLGILVKQRLKMCLFLL